MIILSGLEPLEEFADWAAILDRQIGLKMEIRKVPVETMVIDSASRPGGN